VVFNLCETFFSDRAHEPNVPALLELMKVPYTGAGPDALMLCKDKALAKKLLAYHKVRVARFVVSSRERPLRRLRKFTFPAFVKPVGEESSDGIARASLAKTEEEAIERARFLHDRFESDALIEEYVDGRELYVGVMGNKRLTVLPPREIFFGEPPVGEDGPRFATAKAKWDDAYRKKWRIRNGPAGTLPPGVERKLTPQGEIVVIEANPNPSLAKEDDFAQAAAQVGISYEALIQKLLENAVRWNGESPG
jgi:D-alanine-D-alanine ligase